MGWKRSPKLTTQKLQRIRRQVVRETTGTTGQLARYFDNQTRKRVAPAKNVSKQDDPSGKGYRQGASRAGLTDVNWRAGADGIVIVVGVRGHYTGARSKAIRGVLRYLGRERELKRSSLLVVPGSNKKRARDRLAAGGRAHRVTFAQSSRLEIWAGRQSKGLQEDRHVVVVDRRILEALVLGPTVRKGKDKAIRDWRNAFKKGFL